MELPNELVEIIIGYLEECPDYMNARQTNRQFRQVCQTNRLESKVTQIVKHRFYIDIPPGQLIAENNVLLRLRFAEGLEKSYRQFLCYSLPQSVPRNMFTYDSLWYCPMIQDCIWGLLTETENGDGNVASNNVNEKGPVQGTLVIFKRQDAESCERLFTMDISVPKGRLCQRRLNARDEHDRSATIPFKYITLESYDGREWLWFAKEILVRIIDVWNSKRLDIYLTWDENASSPFLTRMDRCMAMNYSNYGALVVNCWKNRRKFLVIGHPQYLGSDNTTRTAVDMSRLFEYFQYIITNNLTTVVCADEQMGWPIYYPLVKENWFASDCHIFRIPPQEHVPTYLQYLQSTPPSPKTTPQCQAHISLSLNVSKDHPVVVPDFELPLKDCRSAGPIHDNMFAVYGVQGMARHFKILDLRPDSLDLAVRERKIRVLKYWGPYTDPGLCMDDHIVVGPSANYHCCRYTADFLKGI